MSFFLWNPTEDKTLPPKVPVTVFSGFLGAGKTTLLNHVLSLATSEKYAVVVNDLGEINIDAALIKNAFQDEDGPISGMLELQGGCICCSIQGDLLDAVFELWKRHQPAHILIEATGVAEPRSILETFYAGNYFGKRGADFIEVANMVTVLDGGNLQNYFEDSENLGAGERIQLAPGGSRKPLQELLMEQIECADVLLINKADLLKDEDRHRFVQYLRNLNAFAEIWECEFGKVDAQSLVQKIRYTEEKTAGGAAWRQVILGNDNGRQSGWKAVHEVASRDVFKVSSSSESVALGAQGHTATQTQTPHQHSNDHGNHKSCGCGADHACTEHVSPHPTQHHHKDYGLEAFVFNSRRLFSEEKFLNLLKAGLPGVLRAKGFYWADGAPEQVGLLSIAGKIMRADYLCDWWFTQIQRGEAKVEDIPELVRSSWIPEYGDRRQELIFIGIDLDRDFIQNSLIACYA